MSSDDKTGADGESFLSRWSRLKARGGGDDKPAPASLIDANATPLPAQVGEQLADDAPSLIDLTKLPRLEELTSGSDFAAFLQKGVPEELKRLALRKAWSLDPAIRDFVEVAENQYDWNAPGGVPGFGPLNAGADMTALLAQAIGEVAIGEVAASEVAVVEVAPVAGGDKDTAADAAHAETVPPVMHDQTLPTPPMLTAPAGPAAPGPPRPPQRPRHGGALPKLPPAGCQ